MQVCITCLCKLAPGNNIEPLSLFLLFAGSCLGDAVNGQREFGECDATGRVVHLGFFAEIAD